MKTMLTAELLNKVRADAAQNSRPLLQELKEKLALPPQDFIHCLAESFEYTPLNMQALHQLEPAFDLINFAEIAKRQCLLLRDLDKQLFFVFADPFDSGLQAWASATVEASYQRCVADADDIAAYMVRHEESVRATDELLNNQMLITGSKSSIEDLSLKRINEDSSPVVKLVNSTLYDALKTEVSDIHIESTPTGMTIKYRIDGVLNVVGSFSGLEFGEQVISRIKVMSELDISERRVPQDGRFKVTIQGREVDFRVSIMPSSHGEDAVLRILDRNTVSDDNLSLNLEQLGFSGEMLRSIRRLIAVPYGMFLVTGPTGSGKTTTLYAAISEINKVQDKIITIEDPVEYQLPNVLQIPVNEKKGLTFARGLRSILRHDPDKIMVGEIRDPETAQIAVQSALTGHLVFTTVHANNAFDVISRFIHMGVDPYSFVSALNGVMAQRLIRVNCPHCAKEMVPNHELLIDSGITLDDAKQYHFKQGQGCGQCRGSGYKGRKVIGELLILDDLIRQSIVDREPIVAIKERARAKGMRYIREAALDLVKSGETTLEEINRVTFVA